MARISNEKVLAVGLRTPDQTQTRFAYLMEELTRLVETAGGEVAEQFSQTRKKPDPGTLLGSGKLAEIAERVDETGIKTVVFDDDLTAAQQKNIEKIIPAKIVDRTRLILDIFAKRAHAKEGQLQVELAQLNYLVPRLTGSWRGFSQQMGGIGTRGPGERKIEVERRYVRDRIKQLKKNLESVRRNRERARQSRQQVPVPQISLVGYTNVGKSTLLNALVGRGNPVYADDKLFATLDPTTRRVKLPGGQTVLFTDTVGFIQKLPTTLIAAFRATLEEATESNLLIHVVDASAENRGDQIGNVEETLAAIGAEKLPRITVFNKADLLTEGEKKRFRKDGALLISSKNKNGLNDLLLEVQKKLDEKLIEVTFDLPHERRDLLKAIIQTGRIIKEVPEENQTKMKVRMDPANWQKIAHRLSLKPPHE